MQDDEFLETLSILIWPLNHIQQKTQLVTLGPVELTPQMLLYDFMVLWSVASYATLFVELLNFLFVRLISMTYIKSKYFAYSTVIWINFVI